MKVFSKLKEEFFKILPPTIYFFVALHLVMFIRVLLLEGTEVSPSSSIKIAVAALILGKAVLIADMLPIINRFPHKPLIHNIVWKTLIYLLLSVVIHYLERLIEVWRKTGDFAAAQSKITLRNHLATFLGHPDHSIRAHCHRIARYMSWRASSEKKKYFGYFSDRCLPRKCDRGDLGPVLLVLRARPRRRTLTRLRQ